MTESSFFGFSRLGAFLSARKAGTAFLVAALAFTLSACSGDKKEELLDDKPAEELYGVGMEKMGKREFTDAARQFEEVERQHPYSQWATRSQIMAAYAQYQAMDYDDAIATLDGFIQLHPGHSSVAYAHYLRALCFYERIADVRRDQSLAKAALDELQNIVTRFSDTPYARDASLKIALVEDHLAGAEMEIARNYLKQKIYTAAVGRFRRVVEKYQTTSHVPEALHRLVECYLALGITGEARATAAVLGHNFPGSQWYQDSYALLTGNGLTADEDREKRSWIGGVWKKVF